MVTWVQENVPERVNHMQYCSKQNPFVDNTKIPCFPIYKLTQVFSIKIEIFPICEV